MKATPVILFIIFLVSGMLSSAWCQPELVYSENGTAKKIDGIEKSKPYYFENGEKKYFSKGGTCALRLNDADILSIGFIPVNYIVMQNSKNSSSAVVVVRKESISNAWNNTDISSIFKIWDEELMNNSYSILCWYEPDTELLPASDLSLHPYSKGEQAGIFSSVNMNSKGHSGFPVFLLWKDNSFISPQSVWSDNPDLFKSIISGDLKSFENAAVGNYLKAKDICGNRAIHYAAALGRTEIMKKLLSEGANAREKNDNSMTPLLIASATGHEDIVTLLLQQDAELIKYKNKDKRSALHFASYCGHEDIVKILVQYMKNVDGVDKSGFSPVDYAINRKADSIVGLLASKNAKLAADAENQQLVMMGNISGDNYNTVSFLLDKKAEADKELYGTTPLIVAAGSSSLDVVKLLIDSGATISKTGVKDITPLMSACLTGRPEVVKYLLEKGSNVNRKSKDGLSAIEAAVLRNDPEIIDLLLSYNVDIETKDRTGKSPFWLAAMLGYRNSMNILLEAGARCDLDHENAIELMELAFRYDMPEAVDLALSQCLDANFLFYDKYPSTLVAQYYSADEILKLLLEHGAKIDEGQKLGITDVKSLSENPKIIQQIPIYYPMDLKRKYGSRKFKVKVLIDDEGKVLFPKIINSEIHELDKVVMETVTKWRFTAPKDLSGKTCSAVVDMQFLLECEDIEKETWELAEVDQPPRVIKAFPPRYPIKFQKEGIEGRVVLDIIIDENGNPEDIKIFSLTHKEFADAAIECAEKYKFSPAYHQGKPVKTLVKLPIRFSTVSVKSGSDDFSNGPNNFRNDDFNNVRRGY